MYPYSIYLVLKGVPIWVLLGIAEARKLEHHWPHALTVTYRESQHESSENYVPTFWGSLYKYILYGYIEPLAQEREAKEKEAADKGLRAHGSGSSGFA